MRYEDSSGTATVCSVESRDVIKISIDVDFAGVIKDVSIICFGSSVAHRASEEVNLIIGQSIEEAAEYSYEQFTTEEEDLHIGIMIVNAIRMAIANYVSNINESD